MTYNLAVQLQTNISVANIFESIPTTTEEAAPTVYFWWAIWIVTNTEVPDIGEDTANEVAADLEARENLRGAFNQV